MLERLQNYSEIEWHCSAFKESVEEANASNDDMWLIWLAELLNNEKLKGMLPAEMVGMLEAKKRKIP